MPRLRFITPEVDPLTHYWIKYPAKFHPPVARKLVLEFSKPGETVLDPFCGSGSLLIEAAVEGRHSVGSDIDPLAVFASRVKTTRYDVTELRNKSHNLLMRLYSMERPPQQYFLRQFEDVQETTVIRRLKSLGYWYPKIPTLFHWFRPSVLFDLAVLRHVIETEPMRDSHRDFFRLCFAAILRKASNADPVPVSGLEVTSHMIALDELGRVIHPFDLFASQISKALHGAATFAGSVSNKIRVRALRVDATTLTLKGRKVDAIITSPPYNNAVDYHRRHMLEMYWLGFVLDPSERSRLQHEYLGRPGVTKHPFVTRNEITTKLAIDWHRRISSVSKRRGAEFKHYVVGMTHVFRRASKLLAPGAPAVFVIGHSKWNGDEIPTTRLFSEISSSAFELEQVLEYPVINRFMSFARRNGDGIKKEYVLVFRRSRASQ